MDGAAAAEKAERAANRARRMAKPFVPAGHFYSPVGNRAELRAYYESDHFRAQCARVDAMLDYPGMAALWAKISPGMVAFPMEATDGFRYMGLNNQFPYFDASLLSAVIRWLDPKQIIEIGAGWSSAAIFDTLDRMDAPRLREFVTIDPDLSRIEALAPFSRARMIKATVQSQGVLPFAALADGDVLFIDSSHVLKTGSDVHFEYLHILPMLAPGVIVHIHDVFYPFEYPRSWAVQENRSWNEAYLVDMMLTHGRDFELLFFNDAFLRHQGPALMAAGDPMLARFAAAETRPVHAITGSIWLRRRGGRPLKTKRPA